MNIYFRLQRRALRDQAAMATEAEETEMLEGGAKVEEVVDGEAGSYATK
jgi:hypothetical protein